MKFVRLKKKVHLNLVMMPSDVKFIEPKRYTLEYTLYTVPNEDDPTAGGIAQNKAYQKINYFLTSVLDGSILYDPDCSEDVRALLLSYENNVVTLPYCAEIMFLEALHCKFNVLAGENTFVDSLELYDHFAEQSYIYVQEEEDHCVYELPSSKQFVGEFALWDKCWWDRYDITTYDSGVESAELLEEWKSKIDLQTLLDVSNAVLNEIDSQIESSFDHTMPDAAGELIDLEQVKETMKAASKDTQWKPTLV